MKRIVILGNSWHGNWSSSLFKELQKQRENVIHINVLPKHFKSGIFFFDKLIRKLYIWEINKEIIQKIHPEDIVIVITPYTLYKKTFENLQKKNTNLIAWLGDDPFRKGDASMYLPFFKKIYIVDTSWKESIKTVNSRVEILPHAFQEDIFFPFSETKKPYQVSFVGDSFNGTSEGLYRASLIKALYDSGVSVELFGDKGWITISHQYPTYAFLRSIYKGFIKTPEDLNSLYNKSQIVLNIHHRQVKNGANQRVFEASGSRAFQITDKQDLIKDIFGTSIEQYRNSAELIQKVTYFLHNQDEAKQKAQQAWTIVASHTYKKRIEKLLDSQ